MVICFWRNLLHVNWDFLGNGNANNIDLRQDFKMKILFSQKNLLIVSSNSSSRTICTNFARLGIPRAILVKFLTFPPCTSFQERRSL